MNAKKSEKRTEHLTCHWIF